MSQRNARQTSLSPRWLGACLLLLSACSWTAPGPRQEIRTDFLTLSDALRRYAMTEGGYPTSLSDLLSQDNRGRAYVDSRDLLRDPYGNEYAYTPQAGSAPYNIVSYGQDGIPGGSGEAADVDLAVLRDARL